MPPFVSSNNLIEPTHLNTDRKTETMRLLITTAFAASALLASGISLPQDRSDDLPAVAETAPRPAQSPRRPARTTTVRGTSRPIILGHSRFPEAPSAPVAPLALSPFGNAQQDGLFYSTRWGKSKEESATQKRISAAVKSLKSDDREKRAEAEDQLRDAVEEMFDLRSKTREKQIKDLEKRIDALRDQLQQRRDKKAEICRLHVQTLVNQANGLGF